MSIIWPLSFNKKNTISFAVIVQLIMVIAFLA